MRNLWQPIVIVCLTASAFAGAQSTAPDAAAAIMAATRAALGGEARLSAVKTLVATGRTRQVRGDNLVPIEFEIAIELPDKYVRKDEVPGAGKRPDHHRLQRRRCCSSRCRGRRPRVPEGRPRRRPISWRRPAGPRRGASSRISRG